VNTLLEAVLGTGRLEGKALPTTGGEPDLHAITGLPARRLSNRLASRHTGAYGGDDAIDWVMDCVSLYAETTSNATYHFEKEGQRLRNPGEPVTDDNRDAGEVPGDLWNLFTNPNSQNDYTELMELAIIDLLLAGEFFWYKHGINGFGKPDSIYRLPPSQVEVVPGAVSPRGYIFTPAGGHPQEVAPEEMLHVRRPNPHSPWRGLGVIAGGPRAFDLELALTEQMANYFETGTKLSGIAETDRTVPPSTWKKIERVFNTLYAGGKNAGKVAFLERGLRFRSISADAQQAQFVEASKWSRERVANAFRTPVPLLGSVGGSDRQAVRESQRIWDNKTLRPFLNRLQSQISQGLTQAWDLDFAIDYEYVMPIEDRLDLGVDLATLPGIRVRELREQVGFPPLGDERDEWVLNLPGEEREQGGHPDAPIGSEAGRPPNPENTKRFPGPAPAQQRRLPGSADVSAKAVIDAALGRG